MIINFEPWFASLAVLYSQSLTIAWQRPLFYTLPIVSVSSHLTRCAHSYGYHSSALFRFGQICVLIYFIPYDFLILSTHLFFVPFLHCVGYHSSTSLIVLCSKRPANAHCHAHCHFGSIKSTRFVVLLTRVFRRLPLFVTPNI